MKILSIGNSFSADAHAYLHALAEQRGIDLTTVNLAIGGCSLQTHWDNVVNEKANYLHSVNGGAWAEQLVTIEQILKADYYDVVTFQQVSHFSGQYETYQPYLNDLISYVRDFQPSADLYFHRTWAYETDSQHSEFPIYDRDQRKMYNAICKASEMACLATGATLIPSGDVIQALRERIPAFDYANGGESLCCDGFHMSMTYGRYAVALTWLATFTGKHVEPLPFMELDLGKITQICDIVNEIVFAKQKIDSVSKDG
ncbi:MAG: DUF4886 domain-containing protein [Clostridia bacterium]|nr:DUF4886 domain-containing protein [Clostridia bacterium]